MTPKIYFFSLPREPAAVNNRVLSPVLWAKKIVKNSDGAIRPTDMDTYNKMLFRPKWSQRTKKYWVDMYNPSSRTMALCDMSVIVLRALT